MANRILALAGKGKGPKVYTGNFQKIKAKVCGLEDGQVVDIEGADFWRTITENGLHELPCSDYIVAHYHGERFMICTLHAG